MGDSNAGPQLRWGMGFACDVLVAGSGAGGLAAAVTAREAGLEVLVAEKEPWFGGTTALSGGCGGSVVSGRKRG